MQELWQDVQGGGLSRLKLVSTKQIFGTVVMGIGMGLLFALIILAFAGYPTGTESLFFGIRGLGYMFASGGMLLVLFGDGR